MLNINFFFFLLMKFYFTLNFNNLNVDSLIYTKFFCYYTTIIKIEINSCYFNYLLLLFFLYYYLFYLIIVCTLIL